MTKHIRSPSRVISCLSVQLAIHIIGVMDVFCSGNTDHKSVVYSGTKANVKQMNVQTE